MTNFTQKGKISFQIQKRKILLLKRKYYAHKLNKKVIQLGI